MSDGPRGQTAFQVTTLSGNGVELLLIHEITPEAGIVKILVLDREQAAHVADSLNRSLNLKTEQERRDIAAPQQPAPAPSGWQPASEPPDSSRDVVVMVEGYTVPRVGFYGGCWWRYDMDGGVIEANITHWHELPAPPK